MILTHIEKHNILEESNSTKGGSNMKFQFGNFFEVDTKGLIRFGVLFTFSHSRMRDSDQFKEKTENTRNTSCSKTNPKSLPKN